MTIDERNALNTQKPQAAKLYETMPDTASRPAKQSVAAGEDGVALGSQDQLRVLASTPSAADTSRIERLTQLVQSGQYQVDPLELGGAMVAAMLKGY